MTTQTCENEMESKIESIEVCVCDDVVVLATGKPGYKQLSVYDIEDYSLTPESNAVDIDFTRSLCALAATWRVAATPGKVPERYEWSVGVEGHTIGGNLLDVDKEPIWRDTGHAARAVYTTRSSRESGRSLMFNTNKIDTFSNFRHHGTLFLQCSFKQCVA